jgi:hypothetical protein
MRLMRCAAALAAVLWTLSALAQEPPPDPFRGRPRDGAIVMLGVRDAFEGKTVKGVPYSARTETEIVQNLADGNRIVNRTTGFIARDSEGRTRREQALAAIGALVVGPQAPRIVAIHDPVEQVTYLLEGQTKTARRLRDPADRQPGFPRPGFGPPPAEASESSGRAEEESLGTRSIEGLTAEGTRRIVTLPEGVVGNERPIQIVSERWYSPEVQAQVATSHSDPRFGESRYRLTDVDRREPDKALFEVPRDYTIQEGPLRGSDRLGPRQPKRQ